MQSSKRTFLLFFVAQVALIGISIAGAHHIRTQSTSPGLDVLSMAFLTALLMVDAGFVARGLLHLLNVRKARQLEEAGLSELKEAFTGETSTTVLKQSALYVVSFALLATLLDTVVLGGFTAEYARTGRFATILRAENPEATEKALIEMAEETLGPDLKLYVDEFMVPSLSNGTAREAALTALQITGERMGKSSDLIVFTNAESGGWEQNLLLHLQSEPASRIRSLLLEELSSKERGRALQALGSFRSRQDLEVLENALTAKDEVVRTGAIWGLAYFKGNADAARILVNAVRREEADLGEEEKRYLAFAVGEVMMVWQPSRIDDEANREVGKILGEFSEFLIGKPLTLQCVGIDAIRKSRISTAAPALFQLFEEAKKGVDCEQQSHLRAPLSPLTLATHGDHQFRILDALSLMAVGEDSIQEWVEEIRRTQDANPTLSLPVREALRSLSAKLQRGQ